MNDAKLFTVIIYFQTTTANGKRKNDRIDVIVMAPTAENAIERAVEKAAKAHHTRGFVVNPHPDFAPTAIESQDGVIFA